VKTDVNVVGNLKATEEKCRIWIRVRDPRIRIRMIVSNVTNRNKCFGQSGFPKKKAPLLCPTWIPEFTVGTGKRFVVLYFAQTG
jgi:hypothetical protein